MIITIVLTIVFLFCFITTCYLIWLLLYVKDYPAPNYPPVIKQSTYEASYKQTSFYPTIPAPIATTISTPDIPYVQEYYYPPRRTIASAIAEYSPPSYDEITVDDNTIE